MAHFANHCRYPFEFMGNGDTFRIAQYEAGAHKKTLIPSIVTTADVAVTGYLNELTGSNSFDLGDDMVFLAVSTALPEATSFGDLLDNHPTQYVLLGDTTNRRAMPVAILMTMQSRRRLPNGSSCSHLCRCRRGRLCSLQSRSGQIWPTTVRLVAMWSRMAISTLLNLRRLMLRPIITNWYLGCDLVLAMVGCSCTWVAIIGTASFT